MEEYRVVPDLISEVPPFRIAVKFDNLEVDMGNPLTPTQVHEKPSISWEADNDALYTLFMVDPDLPRCFGKEAIHWLVVNIPGSNVGEGNTIFEYFGSGPPPFSGYHRYIFLVYKQSKSIEKNKYDDINDVQMGSRRAYTLNMLVNKFELDNPIAGNFFRAKVDKNFFRILWQHWSSYR